MRKKKVLAITCDDESESDEDEIGVRKRVKFHSFNAKRDMNEPNFSIGMLFITKEEFKQACKQWGIKHILKLHFPKNNKLKVRCEC